MEMKTCCEKEGAWSSEEDEILMKYVQVHGEGNWRLLPKRAGLKRCGESCKHRWLNYLKPTTTHRGNISLDEEELIIRLHKLLGNRWSLIAGRLPGRTENEIEHFWNTHLSRKEEEEKEKHNNNELLIPSTSVAMSTKIPGVDQSLRCTKNSFHIDPTEYSPHPVIKPKAVRLTKAVMPTQNGSNNNGHNVNPSASTNL